MKSTYLWRRCLAVMAAMLLFAGSVLCLASYLVTGRFDPGPFVRLCLADPASAAEKTYPLSNQSAQTDYDLRSDGTAKNISSTVNLDGVDGPVYLLRGKFHSGMEKKRYDLRMTAVSGNGLIAAFKANAVYRGQDSVLFFPGFPACERVLVELGESTSFADLSGRHLLFDSITVNDRDALERLRADIPGKLILSCLIVGLCVLFFLLCRQKELPRRLLAWEDRHGITPEKQFLLWGVLMGLTFLILLPILQAPDEGAHLHMIQEERGYSGLESGILGALGRHVDLGRLMTQSGERLLVEDYLAALSEPMRESALRAGFPTLQLLRHFPQALGIQLGLWLGLSASGVFFLGRLAGLAFYLGIGYYTIRIMPYRKTLMMVLMSCPMALQQAASLSYDCTLNALSFLMIAWFLHLREREEPWGWKEMLLPALFSVPMALIKINYLALWLLVFLIPLDKWQFRCGAVTVDGPFLQSHRRLVAGALSAVLAVGIFVLTRLGAGRLLLAFVLSPGTGWPLLLRTLVHNLTSYAKTILGVFGWLDTYVPNWFYVVLIGLWALAAVTRDGPSGAGEHRCRLYRWPSVVIVLLTAAAVVITCIVVMFSWTMLLYGVEMESSIQGMIDQLGLIHTIEGVQGRYFLPILPLPFLLLPGWTRRDWGNLLRVLAQTVVLVTVFAVLLDRYWIFA